MKTFSGSITKEQLLKEIIWHREQDMIIKGTYGKGSGKSWKGCAVGCSIHSINRLTHKRHRTENHNVYESELGIPEWLARLEDTIFESLPDDEAMTWPERFIQSIPVGVDLEPVKWKFFAYLMKENIDRVLKLNITDGLKKQVVDAIRQVLAVHEEAIETGQWNESAARSARSAWSAARSAAWSAASSAWYAASSAWYAAESARSAASSAWSAAYQKYADKLVELCKKEGYI